MLTPRKAAFCAAYILEPNATKAALSAGYSPATAKQQGSRLLTDVDVVNMLRESNATAVQIVSERQEEAIGSAAWIIEKAGEVVNRALNAVPVYEMRDGQKVIVEGEWTCNLSAATPALALLAKRVPEFRDAAPIDQSQHLHLDNLTDEQLEAIAMASRRP